MTFEAMLDDWLAVRQEAARLADRERALRKALFTAAFPDPKEGTATIELVDGRRLKGIHKINRTIDEGALSAVVDQLRKENAVSVDELFPVKHSLGIKQYRKLSPRVQKLADRAIVARPGTPTLEVE